ncbi:MAG: hypothetical protein GWN58_56470, partial [Anaerolineae bacterium]|nr:hypothetical protein [Anaerolineae bacterium]
AVPLSVGIVRTDPRPLLIEALERHLDREEWVYVLNQSMIQVVALSMPAAPHQPSAESVKAFLLEPGQGVIMDRGVWHSAGLPVGDQSVYYGFVLGRSRSDTGAEGNPWVPFAGHERVVLEVQPRSGR